MDEVLKSLINNSDFADVKFRVGTKKQTVYGHQLILGLSSVFWKRLFYDQLTKLPQRNNGKEGGQSIVQPMIQIDLPDVTMEIFLIILEHCYTRKSNLSQQTCLPVYEISLRLGIPELAERCLEYISQNLSVENCLLVLDRSNLNSDTVRERALNFVERSRDVLAQTNCLSQLRDETINSIVNCKALKVSEIVLFDRLFERGIHILRRNGEKILPEKLQQYIGMHLNFFRFELLSQKSLQRVANSGILNKEQLNNLTLALKKLGNSPGRDRSRSMKSRDSIKVLLLAADDSKEFREDVKLSIQSTGIKHVDIINAHQESPSISTMLSYDSIFVYSGFDFKNPVLVGKRLATYVESGRGLVICTCTTMIKGSDYCGKLKGRIINDGFIPIAKGNYLSGKQINLGSFISEHDIMNGVKSFDGGEDSGHIESKTEEQSSSVKVIANWKDGNILVSTSKLKENFGSVVALNLWPVSSMALAQSTGNPNHNLWNRKTDGALLMANSVEYVANN
ncbi:btb (poz) domain-containing 2a-related [Anaeramoeba flamelloides]|uniref:Btb (Poz) domain-containing 2a-related n=1 Tax=Anaeramoeba flamelloides TaxID=1746091 RepID=A0ABQ8Z3L4_9EUKA|nr:btb (poz) domain-containing 2a-related [Anaeramoeba flamelloides]